MVTEVFNAELNVTLVLSTKPAKVSDYTLYEGKVWKVTASETTGGIRAKRLDRELTSEVRWVGGSEVRELPTIIKPSGYIRV